MARIVGVIGVMVVVCSGLIGLAHALARQQDPPPLAFDPPLRILLVSAEPAGQPELDVDTEPEQIVQAVQDAVVMRAYYDNVKLENLITYLEQQPDMQTNLAAVRAYQAQYGID